MFGLEGDIDWSDIKGSFTNVACPFGCEIKNEWLGTARGRVGYAMDRVMPYVTGGLAFGDVSATVNGVASRAATPTSAGRSAPASKARSRRTGPPSSNISTSISATRTAASLACGAFANNIDFTAHIVRAGLNYKF